MKTLNDLGYELFKQNDKEIIYIKYLGDNEISLNLDINTGIVSKYVNDFRKNILIKPDELEIILMENLLD